jgi:hypothetical protein
MKPPLTHTFVIDGETFTLTEVNHTGERQIQIKYAQLVAPAPLLDALFYEDLLAEATAAVCMTEAPPWCWKTQVSSQPVNGTPARVFDIGESRRFWPKLRIEVDTFRGLLRDAATADAGHVAAPGSDAPSAPPVAPAETLPAAFRGQAV